MPVWTTPHNALYVTDDDGNFTFPDLVLGAYVWAKATEIGDKPCVLLYASAAISKAGVEGGMGTGASGTSDAWEPGRVVHMIEIRDATGRRKYGNEMYPSTVMDAVSCGYPCLPGDTIWVRGVTASVRAGFHVQMTLTFTDDLSSFVTHAPRTILDRPYCKRRVTGADPAANAEWVITAPARAMWEIIAVEATLVTDANAANRSIYLIAKMGSDELWRAPSGQNYQAASLTYGHNWAPGISRFIDGNVQNFCPIPMGARLSGKQTLNSLASARQAGDNWGVPVVVVLERVVEGYATEVVS